MSGRSYGDHSYGGHQTVTPPAQYTSLDGTYQSATDLQAFTLMYPCKALDWNISVINGGTNLGADFEFIVGKKAAGTGTFAGMGTSNLGGSTGTHANGTVIDCALTETTFSAGDDIVIQIIGTVGHAWISTVNLEIQEVFEVGDS